MDEAQTQKDTVSEAGRVIANLFPEYRTSAYYMARELNASERGEVIAAEKNRATARQLIKAVFARNYDRLRDQAAAAVPQELERDRAQNAEVIAAQQSQAKANSGSGQTAETAAPPPASTTPAEAVPVSEPAATTEPVPGGTTPAIATVEPQQ